MVSAGTKPCLFGDAGLCTAATTAFHGQWLVAWAVNPLLCTSPGLCTVSDRRLSADFRRRQHRLLATRPHRERRAALAWSTACWCHWWRPPSERMTTGQKFSASFPPARDVPKEGKRYEQDRQVRGRPWPNLPSLTGAPSRPSVRRWPPMPDSRIDFSNILPLSSH